MYYNDMNMNMDMGMIGMGMQSYQQPRVTKAEVKAYISNYCYQNTGTPVTRTVEIEDNPQYLKHACSGGGIQLLSMFNIPVEAWGIYVPFYYCVCCGELVLVKDSM